MIHSPQDHSPYSRQISQGTAYVTTNVYAKFHYCRFQGTTHGHGQFEPFACKQVLLQSASLLRVERGRLTSVAIIFWQMLVETARSQFAGETGLEPCVAQKLRYAFEAPYDKSV